MDATASVILVAGLAFAFHAGRHYPAAPAHPGLLPQKTHAEPAPVAFFPLVSSPVGSYRAQVTKVIDGDTIEARVQIWPGQEIITKLRLRGIDAPEIKGACGPEVKQGEAARDRLAALIGNQMVIVTEIGPDKYYGRVVARILTTGVDGPVDAGTVLVSERLARPYGGKRRESWCILAGG